MLSRQYLSKIFRSAAACPERCVVPRPGARRTPRFWWTPPCSIRTWTASRWPSEISHGRRYMKTKVSSPGTIALNRKTCVVDPPMSCGCRRCHCAPLNSTRSAPSAGSNSSHRNPAVGVALKGTSNGSPTFVCISFATRYIVWEARGQRARQQSRFARALSPYRRKPPAATLRSWERERP
jgi:hypothetical protein